MNWFVKSLFISILWLSLLLTHWGHVTHICVSKLTIIGPDDGLSPGRFQTIIWTNTGILLIGPSKTNFNETLIEIYVIPFKKMHLKLSSGNWRPFCLSVCHHRHQDDRRRCRSQWPIAGCGLVRWILWNLGPLLLTWFNFNPSMDK